MADLLELDDIAAGYGEALVLSRISFQLAEGEALALLGRNGTGKTTLINTIVGLTRRRAGKIRLGGRDLTHMPSHERAKIGIGWVPQERNIFRSLTVDENITAVLRKGMWNPPRIYGLFPRLAERRGNMGNQLSGGEQQMLAIARALALNPRLLLLDEPLEGLAPILVDELLAALRKIIREEGLAAILVEQSPRKILPLTQNAIILDRGRIAFSGLSAELAEDSARLAALLGVEGRG
jgi:branched-chain amino acid transport system ATP-binding protein